MPRTRKTAALKKAAKRANAANIDFVEKLDEPVAKAAAQSVRRVKAQNIDPVIKQEASKRTSKPESEIPTTSTAAPQGSPQKPLDLSNLRKMRQAQKIEFTQARSENDEPCSVNNNAHLEDVSSRNLIDEQFGESSQTLDNETSADVVTSNARQTPCTSEEALEIAHEKILKLENALSEAKTENNTLHQLNMKLQRALLDKPGMATFTEIDGFPRREWLLKVSQASNKSDYLFVKELVLQLWPNGMGNATVTGKGSNNPAGASKKPRNVFNPDDPGQLDPVKINYIKDRLYERRILLQDSPGTAMQISALTPRYISRIMANNPSVKSVTA